MGDVTDESVMGDVSVTEGSVMNDVSVTEASVMNDAMQDVSVTDNDPGLEGVVEEVEVEDGEGGEVSGDGKVLAKDPKKREQFQHIALTLWDTSDKHRLELPRRLRLGLQHQIPLLLEHSKRLLQSSRRYS